MTRTRLSESEIKLLLEKHPQLPSDYLEYLRLSGWGETDSGHQIYSGPVSPKDIYSNGGDMPALLILGDDFQGFCFAYSLEDCVYGEISDDGEWSPSEDGMTVIDYATGPQDLDLL